ncbi:MAG TPA: lysylphosphatidylglycerol synthase transmembrane domain-containing protein [Steroidobacteraceae bacterium]
MRVVACVVLLILAARQVDVGEVLARADTRLLWAVVLGGVLIAASAWPQAARWRLIADMLRVRLDRLLALRATLISFFLLAVTPSTVAADGARAIALRGSGSDWTRAIHSVLVDRLLGLATLLLLAFAGMPLLFAAAPPLRNVIGWPLFVAMIAAASGIALLARRLPRRWLRFRSVREWARLVRTLRTVLTDRRFLFGASLSSLIIMALSMTAFSLIAAAAGARADLATVLGIFPIVLLASVLPISVGGWGSRELGLVAIYPYFGTERPIAMAVSVAFGLATLGAGVICIVASYWIRPRSPAPANVPTSVERK